MSSQYVKFGTRMACYIGDLCITNIIALSITFLFLAFGHDLQYPLLISLIWIIYSTIMDASHYRGTFGKKLMGVKVEHQNGSKLKIHQSLARHILGFVVLGPLIGMISIPLSRKKQGLHDLMVGSVVRYR
jgi:uncharacterized RDD family membrane protein YckC